MGLRGWLPLAALLAAPSTADADGACVTIDVARDNLAPAEQAAVRVAIATALESEGVVVEHASGRCMALVVAYNIRLDATITTTLVSGSNKLTGRASSINELDLLVRQLVRSLVTGRAFATGTGVQDRENVLRDQTAPLRVEPSSRKWETSVGFGGGMLQLPAIEGRALQRQTNIFVIEARQWGFITGSRNAIELRGRLVFHDYAVFGAAYDAYERAENDNERDGDALGRGTALLFSPLGVANWETGLGFTSMLGDSAPRPYIRGGAAMNFLCRFSDPDHYFDVGLGFYGGLGLQLTRRVSLSVEASASRPVVHDFMDSGYSYFLTTTAMLEVRGDPVESPIQPDPIPTIRRIND